MEWESTALWQKSQVYARKALTEDRDSAFFPFFMALSLEFALRAAVSSVHPVLLADRKSLENILYALGKANPKAPKSSDISEVIATLGTVDPSFSEDDRKFALSMVSLRNQELHTGELAFENMPIADWQSKLYKVFFIICRFQQKTIAELLGPDEARVAEEMIRAQEENATTLVKERINICKRFFDTKDDAEKAQKRIQATERMKGRLPAPVIAVTCPSCGAEAALFCEKVGEGPIKIVDQELKQNTYLVGNHLHCYACELDLRGKGQVHAAGFGRQYSVEATHDPVDILGIDPMEYVDPSQFEDEIIRHYEEQRRYDMYGDK